MYVPSTITSSPRHTTIIMMLVGVLLCWSVLGNAHAHDGDLLPEWHTDCSLCHQASSPSILNSSSLSLHIPSYTVVVEPVMLRLAEQHETLHRIRAPPVVFE
ncbi:DUF2607 family protein [Kistimonas asteriae]|uniref:DUF2607 family protein n=1 Tax=Kistimonas asteriae TaxID=517724 RepID=UPI001BA4C159|nr:DUF2607 family protein [Kistimonas asteriae]